jgi:hypothetical protein
LCVRRGSCDKEWPQLTQGQLTVLEEGQAVLACVCRRLSRPKEMFQGRHCPGRGPPWFDSLALI